MADGTSEPRKQSDPILEFLGKNVAIAAALFVLLLALLKLAAVTHYDPTTMLTLANTVGASSILTGTFFSPPWPGLLLLETLCLRWFLLARHRGWARAAPSSAAGFFAVLLALLLPTAGAVVFGLVLLAIAGEWSLRRVIKRTRGLEDRARVRTINALTMASIAFVVVWSAFLNSAMWLPKEIILVQRSKNHVDVIQGYVLGTDGNWVNVLVSGIRKIRRVEADSIEQRTVCLHHATEPLWWTKLPGIDDTLGKAPPRCKLVLARAQAAHAPAPVSSEARSGR